RRDQDHHGGEPAQGHARVGPRARPAKDHGGCRLHFLASPARRRSHRRSRLDAARRSRSRTHAVIQTPPRPSLESVTTINEDGSRRFIHTAAVRGRFTRRRAILALALTALYVALPWIRINGNPAFFLDVAHRQFHYFGLTFLGQDIWIAFFV